MAERGGTPAPQSRMDTHGVRAAHSSLWLMPPSGDRGGRAATPGEARVQRDLHGRTAHSGQANATQEVPPTSHQGQSHHRPSHLSPILPPSPLLFFLLTKLLLFFEDPFMCAHPHMRVEFLFQSLNEVFAENLQFPRGLNLAKTAFLTLLGLNSNKPPLYYRTRSHCLDIARKSFIGREGWVRRERGSERKEHGDRNWREESSLNLMEF